MTTETHDEEARKDERELCRRIEAHFARLEAAERLEWRREVRMLHWRHAADSGRRIIRVDYVCRFDGGPLVGIEAKKAPARAADIGRYIRQCADYSVAVIGVNSHIPNDWIGQPLRATFLAVEIAGVADYIRQHMHTAPRLASAFRVGFIRRSHTGLNLTLSDDGDWWSEKWGYRADAETFNSNIRCGNGGAPLNPKDDSRPVQP